MSVQCSYALIRRAFFLFFLLIGDPPPSLGSLSLEEEQRQTGRSPTPIQQLAVYLRDKVLPSTSMFFPDSANIPRSISTFADESISELTVNVFAFLNAQLFTISGDTSPSRSLSIKARPLEVDHTDAKRVVTEIFPSSLTVFNYLDRLNSFDLEEAAENASYARLLEEWGRKFSPNMPYTPFLPGVRLKEGMLIFCLRPQEVPYAREFLSHLYDILKNLRDLKKAPLTPSHLGLQKVFRIFENHRENKEEVLRRWGGPLLDAIEEFYQEQNVVFKWEMITRAFIAAREEAKVRLQEANSRIEANVSQINQIERARRFERQHTFQHIRTITHSTKEGTMEALNLWHLQAQKYYTTSYRYDLETRTDPLKGIISNTSSTIEEYYQIEEESQKLESALAIAQYFSKRPGIQFANPFRVIGELWPHNIHYQQIQSSSDLLGITPLYTLLNNLLDFTLRQVKELSQSPDRLARKLPPLSLVPEEHQEGLVIAYRDEIGLDVGIEAFTRELKHAEKKFDTFGKRVMKKALSQIDTEEKRELVSLQKESKTRTFEPEIQRRWIALGQIVFREELEHSEPSVRAWYLDLQNEVTRREYVVKRFKLKHHRAQLNLIHTQIMILMHPEKEVATFREHLAGLTAKIQQVEDALKELEIQFAQKSRGYEEDMKKLVEEEALKKLKEHNKILLDIPGIQNPQIISILERALLYASQNKLPTSNAPTHEEIERIFKEEQAKIFASIDPIISSMKSYPYLPHGLSLIENHITTFKTEVEQARLDSKTFTLLEMLPRFLQESRNYLVKYTRPHTTILNLIPLPSLPSNTQVENTSSLSGKKAAAFLRKIRSSDSSSRYSSVPRMPSSMLTTNTNSPQPFSVAESSNSQSSSSSINSFFADLADQLEKTMEAFEKLPQTIIRRALQKTGITLAD